MAEEKKKQEELNDEQLDEVSGGRSPINLIYPDGVEDGDFD